MSSRRGFVRRFNDFIDEYCMEAIAGILITGVLVTTAIWTAVSYFGDSP